MELRACACQARTPPPSCTSPIPLSLDTQEYNNTSRVHQKPEPSLRFPDSSFPYSCLNAKADSFWLAERSNAFCFLDRSRFSLAASSRFSASQISRFRFVASAPSLAGSPLALLVHTFVKHLGEEIFMHEGKNRMKMVYLLPLVMFLYTKQ